MPSTDTIAAFAGPAPSQPRFRSLAAALILLLSPGTPPAPAAEPAGDKGLPVLGKVRQIRALTSEEAGVGIPVRLSGVLTFADVERYMCFLQDDTGGVFVEVGPTSAHRTGERVEIEGRTAIGIFTPIVRPSTIRTVGRGEPPPPRMIFLAELRSGHADADWVQVDGQVRAVTRTNDLVRVKFAVPEGTFLGWVRHAGELRPEQLIGSRVRMRGVCAGSFGPRNEALGFDLFGDGAGALEVLERPPVSDDRIPVRPIRELGTDWRNGDLLRARCRGTVTYHAPGRFAFVQDSTGVVELRLEERLKLAIGDELEAVGFREFRNDRILLDSCSVRRLGSGTPIQARRRTLREIYARLGHGDLTTVEGTLAAVVHQPKIRFPDSAPEDFDTRPVLVMKAGDWYFQAELPTETGRRDADTLRPGSVLSLTGVVALEPTDPGEPATCRLLLPSLDSVRVLENAPWWSRGRLLGIAGGFLVVTVSALGWIVGFAQRRRRRAESLVKRNQDQTILHQSVLLELGRITRAERDPDALPKITELIARTLEVSRVSVWVPDEDGRTLRCADLHCGGRHEEGLALEVDAHPAYFSALAEGRCLSATDARTDPRTRGFAENYLVPQDIHSMLDVPFRLSHRLGGVLCLEQTGRPRRWTLAEESFAAGAADQLTILMESRARARAEQSLREAHGELEVRVLVRTTELAEARDRAESADRLKSAFLATMSHELRTPLNSIIGFTGILLQGLVGEVSGEQRKQLGMVMNSARHLLSLINDVLDLSRIEAGQMEVRRVGLDLREPVEHARQIIAPLAAKKELPIELHCPDRTVPVFGDRRRIEQILINLLANAVKFTERGGIRVSLTTDGLLTRLDVTDTGSGIRAEDLARIFKPFQQLDTGLTRQHDGTGLGLTICEKLAKLMGGSITVTSEVGRGSTFTLNLPTAPVA